MRKKGLSTLDATNATIPTSCPIVRVQVSLRLEKKWLELLQLPQLSVEENSYSNHFNNLCQCTSLIFSQQLQLLQP